MLFRSDGATSIVQPPRVGTLDDLVLAVRERAQHCDFVGEFSRRRSDEIREAVGPQAWNVTFSDESLDFPRARHVAQLAVDALLHDDGDDSAVATVAPMYLRDADADINWATRGNV